jgi:hypothetical protein
MKDFYFAAFIGLFVLAFFLMLIIGGFAAAIR